MCCVISGGLINTMWLVTIMIFCESKFLISCPLFTQHSTSPSVRGDGMRKKGGSLWVEPAVACFWLGYSHHLHKPFKQCRYPDMVFDVHLFFVWYFAAREDRIGQPDRFYRQVCGSEVDHSVASGHISDPFSAVPIGRPVKASLASGSSKGSQTDPQLCAQDFACMCQSTYLFKSISDLYAFDLKQLFVLNRQYRKIH